MFYLKLIIYSFICLQLSWSASVEDATDEFSSKELDKSIALSNEEVAVKSNWLPICQQVQVNEPESTIVAQESNVVYLPQRVPEVVLSSVRTTVSSDDICEAPHGLGLKNLLKESKALLPYDRLKSIIQGAAHDVEVERVKDLFTSENFRAKVHDFIESPHFIILRDYICRALNLDVKYYVQFVRSLIAIEKLKEPTENNSVCKGRTGIRGLIEDLKDALPKQQLRDLYVRLLISDEHLVAAIRRMKSTEFRQLLENLAAVKEFNELKKMVTETGVPLTGAKELIDTALGWQGDEFSNQGFEEI